MVKYFCDSCGVEITKSNSVCGGKMCSGRLGAIVKAKKGRVNSLSVEIITSLNATANDGIFCKYCVLDALQALDDRPKETP